MISESTFDYNYRVLNTDVMQYEDKIDKIDCYKITYYIPEDYEIPTNLNFKLTEYCLGNQLSLISYGTKWTGKNVLGRSNRKIESIKLYLRVVKKYIDYGASGCYVRCKLDSWNCMLFSNTSSNYMDTPFNSARSLTYLANKDGSVVRGSTLRMNIERYQSKVESYSKDGYD